MTQQSPAAESNTFLFVDDEPNILNALKRLFRGPQRTILTATSAAAGHDLLAEHRVDVVVSDMRMPEMDGATFLKHVREKSPDTQRILLTGYADIASTIAAVNDGGSSRYLAKPWKDEEILSAVMEAAERNRLRREVERLNALAAEQNEQLRVLNTELEGRVKARTADLQKTLVRLKAANGNLKQGFLTTVRVFSDLLELRDGAMGGHSRRVGHHARALARAAKLDEAAVQNVMLAGLLHDVGKMGFPDELLKKPYNTLKPEERSAYIRHAERGAEILMSVEQLREAANLVRHHHERWDGAGYPDRLTALAIPFGAQILSLANDYDSLLQGHLTARNLSSDEALTYIADNAGKRYNPDLATLFIRMIRTERGEVAVAGTPMRPGALRQGMRLAQDLLHPEGYLLLPKGHACDEDTILQLRRLEQSTGRHVIVHIADAHD